MNTDTPAELVHASILVVDDEPANVKLLQVLLDRAGYRNVVALTDAREVEAAAANMAFDLIILDLNMPHLNGFAVMELLHARLGTTAPPVLMLTAQHDREFRVRALRSGARDFVGKPFDYPEFLARVRNLLEAHAYQVLLRNNNSLLESQVRARTAELHDSRLQVVRHLGRAAEYRDNETGLHIIRMSKISVSIARSLDWPDARCDLLLNASPMHDIGKIGIPDHILLKPARLDAEEWSVMQRHTVIGGEILAGESAELLRMAHEIALNHHEKWDGSGYPQGLRGESIPVTARIVAIADVFDALTSRRPYKPAWPVNDATAWIRAQAGQHFDPDITERFFAALPAVVAIARDYAEPA
jgi:putative two-component system response regulator